MCSGISRKSSISLIHSINNFQPPKDCSWLITAWYIKHSKTKPINMFTCWRALSDTPSCKWSAYTQLCLDISDYIDDRWDGQPKSSRLWWPIQIQIFKFKFFIAIHMNIIHNKYSTRFTQIVLQYNTCNRSRSAMPEIVYVNYKRKLHAWQREQETLTGLWAPCLSHM